MTKIPGIKHFCLEELVDKPLIEIYGAGALKFVDRSMALCLDRLREAVGPLTVNNWHVGGAYHESGVRLPISTTGARYSQHKFGRAYDLKPRLVSVLQLYRHIIDNQGQYPEITAIENPARTPTWLHVDGRWHDKNSIILVEP